MDLSKFTYSKKDSRLTPKSLVHQSITQNKENCQVYETSCLLLTKSLKGSFPPVLYSYSLEGRKRKRIFFGN